MRHLGLECRRNAVGKQRGNRQHENNLDATALRVLSASDLTGSWQPETGATVQAAAAGLPGVVAPGAAREPAGALEPDAAAPEGVTMLPGPIAGATPHDALISPHASANRARVEDATRYVSLDRLAVSPQCGFASVDTGNPVTPRVQEAKLRLVVELARDIWGEA